MDFKYVEAISPSVAILDKIKESITFAQYPTTDGQAETPVSNTWTVQDEVVDATSGSIKEMVLVGVSKIGSGSNNTKTFYLKMTNNFLSDPLKKKHSSLTLQLCDGYDETGHTFSKKGHPVVFEWANETYTPTDRNEQKPVYMYLNINNNRVAMVVVADPAVNFNDYLKSFMYVGALKPFKFNEYDIDGNVMLTAGAFTAEPKMTDVATAKTYYFGEYTSFGNNTMQMLKTKSGIEFQRHYPAFITQAPPTDKAYTDPTLQSTGLRLEPQGFQASRWTNKYHMSPIYVVHPYEGYRGMMDGCVAVAKHNILHLDELIVDVEGKAWAQEVYRYFDTSTPQTFMNYSANLQMGLAILKEIRYASV